MQTQIEKVKFKSGLPLEIEVLPIAETVAKHRTIITAPHRTEFYNIYWIKNGNATYLIDFEPVELKVNSFLFVNKDRVTAVDHIHKHDGNILLFTENFFAQTDHDLRYLHSTILFNDLLDIPVIHTSVPSHLHDIFHQIEIELAQKNDVYHYQILHNLLHNLLLSAERERRKQGFTEIVKGADLDYTILFKDILEKQFKDLKSVKGYVSQMNISEKRLSEATAKIVGKPPKAIIHERILLEAKRLLAHTNSSIKEIGYELGFGEPTNFIKYFKKHVHNTPIKFRESFRL